MRPKKDHRCTDTQRALEKRFSNQLHVRKEDMCNAFLTCRISVFIGVTIHFIHVISCYVHEWNVLALWGQCRLVARGLTQICGRWGVAYLTAHSQLTPVAASGEWDSIWASWLQPDAKKKCFHEFWPCNSVAYLELQQTVLNLFSITVSSIATCCQHKSTGFPNFSAHVSMFVMPGRVICPWLEARTAWTRTAWTAWFWTCKGNICNLSNFYISTSLKLKIWLFANFIRQAVRVLKDMIRCALQCLTVPYSHGINWHGDITYAAPPGSQWPNPGSHGWDLSPPFVKACESL